MKRRLFEDLVVSAADGGHKRAGLAWPVSLSLHAAAVAGLLALPVLTTEALPDPPAHPIYDTVILPPVHVVPPPPPPMGTPPRPAGGGTRRSGPVMSVPPVVAVPTDVIDAPPLASDEDVLPLPDGQLCVGCIPGPIGPETGNDPRPGGGTVGTGTGPVPVGGLIRPPTKIRDARPSYPTLAQQIRLQGPVVIECIIAPDGRVDQVRVISGPPLLQESALDAVRQWRYTPTLLNGVAVPVIMTVTVHFILS